MTDNVSIRVYRDGELIEEHWGHNVWTQDGLAALAELIAFASYGPDVPFSNDRVKYMGFGIGGVHQSLTSVADTSPVVDYYPSGSNTPPSNGHAYNPLFAINPLVRSLERPVIFTLNSGPAVYPGVGDNYLAKVIPSFTGTGVVEFLVPVTVGSSQLLFSTFTELPLSEIGLFFNSATQTNAFNTGKLAAYHAFDTLLLTAGLYVEFTWRVSL